MATNVLSRAEIENLDSMWKSPGFVPTMVAVASAFGAWSLLLPVLPQAVTESGGAPALAGATTGAFMAATVLTQIMTPWMLRTIGYRPLMIAAAFMLGVPALGHMLGTDAWVVLLFSALRGVGFGAITVAESAIIAELVPIRFLGKATGTLGVFIGLSQMVFLPTGLFLVEQFGYNVVYALAAVIGLVAAVMGFRIPSIKAAPKAASVATDAEPSRQVPIWKLVMVPALALLTLSMSFGAISSFLPAAVAEVDPVNGSVIAGFMLSITGAASLVFRYLVGVYADKTGQPGSMMIPAQVVGFLGMGLMAATVYFDWSVLLLVLAALMFGGAFGAVQNESLLSMFQRLPRSKVSQASAIWNIFFDSGTGIGSVAYGVVVGMYWYSGAFGAGAMVIVLGIVVTVVDRILGRQRISEYDNIRTRLRRVRRRKPSGR